MERGSKSTIEYMEVNNHTIIYITIQMTWDNAARVGDGRDVGDKERE